MLFSRALAVAALVPFTTAHFLLTWPAARGFNDEQAANFPCGGFDSVSSTRSQWPINGGSVQLDMHHSQTKVEVLLALGANPGSNFNVVLRQTFAHEGLGDFCVAGLSLPSGLNISDGTPATIQVVTNGDPSGGLYQCADVILTTNTVNDVKCTNNTGMRITQQNIPGNPNETTTTNPSTTTGGAASPTPSKGAAVQQAMASWIFGAAGVVAFAML